MSETFVIDRLGAQGDGIADLADGPVYVPFALPGETVLAERRKDHAVVDSIVQPSVDRIEPECRHFGTCGGCVIQHLNDDAYRDWKRQKVVDALASAGVRADVADLVPCPPHARRRVALSARRTAGGMLLGFNRMNAHEIVPIEECPVSLPTIVSALPTLRELADVLCNTPQAFRLLVTATESGLDVAVSDSGKLDERRRREVAAFAIRAGLARLSFDGEILIEPRKPIVMFGTATVELPPGTFLQATAEAEAAMAGLVGNHLKRAKRITDLFSGCGSFALRLAAAAEVHAVEGDEAALAALDRAARRTTGLRRVTVERRDLFRRPLTVAELDRFDGLVFDPPRAGAEDQSRQLAKSNVPLVAAVSCNPGTLARDLAILTAGGYRVASVTPIDQFLWSPHIEAVALLEKPKRR